MTSRIELKFPATPASLLLVEEWLVTDGIGFREQHAPRWVHNIYFETPDWRGYADNADGMSRRSKCRLRWYSHNGTNPTSSTSSDDRTINAQFEVKKRANRTGSKLTQKILLGAQDFTDAERLQGHMINSLEGACLDAFHRTPVAVLYNQYRRRYLVDADGLRMTIDAELAFATPDAFFDLDIPLVRSSADAVIEFKFPVDEHDRVVDSLQGFPLRARKNSKFVIGLDHLYQ